MIRNPASGPEAKRLVPVSLDFGTIGPGDTVGIIPFPLLPGEAAIPNVVGQSPTDLRAFAIWIQGAGVFGGANGGVLIIANNQTAGPLPLGVVQAEVAIYNRRALQ